jgi:hypothetical protein
MTVISVIGFILVFVGILLTIPSLCEKIKINTNVGWIMSAIGMLMLAFYDFARGNILFVILCLIFAISDVFLFVCGPKE